MGLAVGIDLGTSGVRACAVDEGGREIAASRQALPASRQRDVEVDQDPAAWWQTVEAVLDELAGAIPADQVDGIAVDGTSATLLLADDRGHPLTPALMYNDRRAAEAAARIATVAPGTTGATGPGSSLAKWLHLARDTPAGRPLHQADWISGRLTGRFDTSDENNALKLGYDPVNREWPAWLDELAIDRQHLPRVLPPGTPITTLLPALADRWGFPRDCRVMAGTTDSTAGFLATGARDPGTAVTSLGSTLVLKVLSLEPVFAPAYGVYSHRLGDRWLVGGASNAGGAVLLQHFSNDQLAAMTPQLQPDQPTGLDYYPLPGPGERFPVANPEQLPRLEPRPDDDLRFFQAILEGLTEIEAEGYRSLARLGAPAISRVITVGGGSRNEAWTRMRNRVLGVPVTTAAHQEAAYGAARLARGEV